MADYEISAKITADSSGFEKGIQNAQKQTKSFSESIKNTVSSISGSRGLSSGLSSVVGKIGLLGGAIAATTKTINQTVKAVKECTAEYRNFESGQKVLAQTLKVTGAESWTNVEALEEMQNKISSVTNYSGKDVQQLQTVLLGFKSIKGEVFEETTDAILDMATVMGMDLTNATQAVAKALDDPIKGLGSLSRQGFVFSESQKRMITNLVAVGKQAEAQKIILDELNTTYGGASRSAVDSATQMKNAMIDLKKELGALLEDNVFGRIRTELLGIVQKTVEGIRNLNKTIKEAREQGEYEQRKSTGTTTQEDLLTRYEEEREKLEQLRDIYADIVNNSQHYSVQEVANATQAVQSYTVQIAKLDDKYNVAVKSVEKQKEETEELERQNAILEKRQEIEELAKSIKQDANTKLAEQEAKWQAIYDVTGKEVSLQEKLDFYQQNLIDALAQSKGSISKENELYKQRIKIIEELQAKLRTPALTTAQQVAMAEQDAKKQVGGVEPRIKTVEEIQQELEAQLDEERKALELKKKLQEERLRNLKETLNNMIIYTKQFAVDVVNVTKEVFNAIGKVFQKGFSAIKKLASLDLNKLLDNLLKFEDSVLTFFVETLSKIPQFISSVLTSVSKMFKSISDYLKTIDLKKIVTDMLNAVSDNAEDLVNNFIEFLGILVSNGIAGLSDWIKGGGFKNLLSALLDLQKGLEEIVVENIDEFVQLILDALPDIMETLKESIISASETFSEIVGPLIDIVMEIILQLIDLITSQEVIDASIEAMGKLFEAMIKNGKFTEIIIKLIEGIVRIASNVPKLFDSIINGIFNGLLEKDWKDFGKKIGEGFKEIFTTGLSSFFGTSKEKTTGENVGSTILAILSGGLSTIFSKHAVGSNNVQAGLSLVGEKGPELVDFRGGERVYTAQNTAKILSGSGNSNNFNVTFNNVQDTTAYTMMKQLRMYNRNMAINGVL